MVWMFDVPVLDALIEIIEGCGRMDRASRLFSKVSFHPVMDGCRPRKVALRVDVLLPDFLNRFLRDSFLPCVFLDDFFLQEGIHVEGVTCQKRARIPVMLEAGIKIVEGDAFFDAIGGTADFKVMAG